MCRVNPYKIRIPQYKQDFWIVSGGYNDGKVNHKPIDEVRPYRILLKKREEPFLSKLCNNLLNICNCK